MSLQLPKVVGKFIQSRGLACTPLNSCCVTGESTHN